MNEKDNGIYSWISERLKERDQDAGEPISTKDTVSKDDVCRKLIWLALSFGLCVLLFGIICIASLAFKPMSGDVVRKIDPFRETSDLHKQGMQFAAHGEYDKAISCFTDAITRGPAIGNHALSPFYLERGKCHEAKGDLLLALADYDQACLRSTAYIDALERRNSICLRLADEAAQEGNVQQVLDYYTQAFQIDDYSILEWKEEYHSFRRLHTYNARKKYLSHSENLAYRMLATADSFWIEINSNYLDKSNPACMETLSSLDRDLLLSLAEWHFGEKNYALTIECLKQVIAKKEFSQLPMHTQVSFQNLLKTLEELLENDVPPGVSSHISRFLHLSISSCACPTVDLSQENNTESNNQTDEN